MKRSKEKIIPKSKTRSSESGYSKTKNLQKEAQHRVKIKRGLRKEFDQQHNLKITSIRQDKMHGIPIWKMEADDDSEWIAVESEDDVRKLARKEHKEIIDSEGISGYADWVVEDNLDHEAMLKELEEYADDDVEAGVYPSKKVALNRYKDIIYDQREREIRDSHFEEKELRDNYLDVDAMIEDVIQNDGEGAILARYDGNIHETPEEIQYWRID